MPGSHVRRSRLLPVWSLLLALVLLAAFLPGAYAQTPDTTVTLVHFSDYHSHAVPFYSEGKPNQAGIARGIAYMKQAKATLPNAIVLDGGDMMNAGSPSWSDKYQCSEWPWLNGVVDAMAVGNHDFDYGYAKFQQCKASVQFPIISANFVVSPTNAPVLTTNGKPYVVKQVGNVKIGLFAIAGPDFPTLVASKNLTNTVKFADPIATAKTIVAALRNDEKVNAVVSFGHEEEDADFALAQQVPGIDVILGTHSHLKADLEKIPNTNTYFISPFQYLTYVDQVQLGFTGGKLTNVTGKLVKMDESIQPDATIAAQVTQMEKDLEADPAYAPKFQKIGSAGVELSVEGIDKSESVLGNFVMDTLRRTAKANAAFSTASSFRASIPPGDIRMEEYLTALPYKNFIMTYDLTGDQIKQVLDYSVSKIGTANFSATSGLRYGIQNGKVTNVFVLKDPANEAAGYETLDPAKTYKVMTTDYQGKTAGGYKDIFAKASANTNTNQVINDVMIAYIKANSPVSAKLDGRVAQGTQTAAPAPVAQPAAATPTAAPPAKLPTTGGAMPPDASLAPLAVALLALAGGWAARRRKNVA